MGIDHQNILSTKPYQLNLSEATYPSIYFPQEPKNWANMMASNFIVTPVNSLLAKICIYVYALQKKILFNDLSILMQFFQLQNEDFFTMSSYTMFL